MKRKDENMAASVRQRLINLSKQRGEDPNLVFIRYAIERFLYRLSCSDQSGKFILKGAMLWAIWAVKPHRPTKDLDLLGLGDASADALRATFGEICEAAVEPDGMTFNPDSIQITEIREELEYPGQRIKLESRLGNAWINIQIDIGFGDSIIPEPIEIDYPTLLDMPSPHIKAYPIETVVAEKLETIVSKGMLNSRMKDFYDLRILAQEFGFDGSRLSEAIKATFTRRGTSMPSDQPTAFTEEFFANPDKQVQWKAFLRTSKLEDVKLELSEVINDIQRFLVQPLTAAANNTPFTKNWSAGGPWE
ncbi:MAG: nucleotidyl transferase AbiEii/AbiGii toxin family protein [Sedimentisphaerales bacterium]|nr:nucleotidyl transferase AbiEii/AbiGii toxin family protein [Sedimentisphaerales bacterium]